MHSMLRRKFKSTPQCSCGGRGGFPPRPGATRRCSRAPHPKTRRRRVVPICASLAQWLEPYRQHEGPLWSKSADTDETAFTDLRESLGIPSRGKDALRHSYGTYRLAVTQNEAQVAKEMGHKVDILHQHYAGLATPEEAERWFAVAPAPAAANVVPISAAVA